MANLHNLKNQLLNDGTISPDEVAVIRRHIEDDGALDFDDVRCLVEILTEADDVCQEFDELFLPLMRYVLLKDGKIDRSELELLLDLLLAGGRIRESEKQLMHDLRVEATEITPEFAELCDMALSMPTR